MYTPHLIHMLSGDKKSPHIRKQEVRFCSSGSNECVWSRHILTQLSLYWYNSSLLDEQDEIEEQEAEHAILSSIEVWYSILNVPQLPQRDRQGCPFEASNASALL
jgi:hypothetical protein